MSAFIVSNRNIVIPGPAGAESCKLTRGYMGPVPDWVPKTAYFKALVADGKVVLSQGKKEKPKEPPEPPRDPASKEETGE